jgi:solute carrier family 39 (zinc transporter), member 1/2/3
MNDHLVARALNAILLARQDDGGGSGDNGGGDAGGDNDGGYTVTVTCDTGNEYDGRLGIRISAIFVILVGSLIGALVPVILARSAKMRVPGAAFFIAKYFGTGVIIATAFLHLLTPAFEALGSPCLEDYEISQYSWAGGIAFMSVIVMFTLELIVSHYDVFGANKMAAEVAEANNSMSTAAAANGAVDAELGKPSNEGSNNFDQASRERGVSYPATGEDHLAHGRDHVENDSYSAFAAQMTAIFILEFGVIFHSIFIGLTLAVAGEEFTVLYIVLVFHQTFEGLGLGSRLATAEWPKSKWFVPYILATAYALSTPISIAAGLGVRQTLAPGSPSTLIINGVFDSISAGILIYTGLVELLAHEFMFNPHMRKAGLATQLGALLCVCIGGGLMALLAKWA